MSQAGIINVIDSNPTIPIYFEADTGFAVALFNVINILGANGITTSATGNTITIDGSGVAPALTLTGNTGGPISPTSDNWNIVTANSTPVFSGSGSTLTLNFSIDNLLLGSNGSSITTAVENVGLGQNALSSLIDGSYCTAIGFQSLQNCNSYFNTAVGSETLNTLTTGSQNCAFGHKSLNVCDSIANSAFGLFTLQSLTSGDGNTVVGAQAATNILTGAFNTILGANAGTLYSGSESRNILINNDGINGESNKIRIGNSSNQNACYIAGITGVTVAASAPVAVSSSGQLSSLGFGVSGRVLTSTGAGSSPTWQALPTAIATINGDSGSITGSTVTIYANNSANTCGASIKFVNSGTTSTLNTTDSNFNVFLGTASGNTTVSGANNSAQGRLSCFSLTTGDSNCALGSTSLYANTTGNQNCAVGVIALQNLVSGSGCVGIGRAAGQNYTSSESNNICIGTNVTGTVGESNTTRIGTGTTKCVVSGITGVTVSGSSPVGVDTNGQLSSLGFGTSGQVLTSNGAATSPTWQASVVNSYTLFVSTESTSYAASTTYLLYMSNIPGIAGNEGQSKFIVPQTGTITAMYGQITNSSAPGPSGNATLNILVNSGSPNLVSNTLDFSVTTSAFSGPSLSIAVTAGDVIQFELVTPAWISSSGGQISATILIKT